jgi:hypothetical protein
MLSGLRNVDRSMYMYADMTAGSVSVLTFLRVRGGGR